MILYGYSNNFIKEKTGPIVYTGKNALSSNLITNGPEQRSIFTCWITRRKNYDIAGRGWAGCMSLPQELYVTGEGILGRKPVEELKKLRGEKMVVSGFNLRNGTKVLDDISGHTMELMIGFKPPKTGNSGIRLRRSKDGRSAVSLRHNSGTLFIEGHGEKTIKVPVALQEDGSMKLNIFMDRAILELYVNDGLYYAVTYMHNDINDTGIELFSEEGKMEVMNIEAWEMNSIWE